MPVTSTQTDCGPPSRVDFSIFAARSFRGIMHAPLPASSRWKFQRRLRRETVENLAFDRRHGVDTAGEVLLAEAGVRPHGIDRGKGKAMRLAANHPFRAVYGVECAPLQHAIREAA